jgi:hypothetical protein
MAESLGGRASGVVRRRVDPAAELALVSSSPG